MLRRIVSVAISTAAAALAVTPGAAQQPITAGNIFHACRWATAHPLEGDAKPVALMCALDPTTPSWATLAVPSPAQVMAAANKDAGGGGGAAATPGPEGLFLQALADVLVDEATASFDQYILSRFVTALCNTDLSPELVAVSPTDSVHIAAAKPHLAALFPATCALLLPDATVTPGTAVLPGLTAVRAALRRDVAGLPPTILGLLSDPAIITSVTVRDRVGMAAIIVGIATELRTRPVRDAMTVAAESLKAYATRFGIGDAPDGAYPLMRNAMVVTGLVSMYAGDQGISSWNGKAPLYVLDAFAVNVCAGSTFSQKLIEWKGKTCDAAAQTALASYWTPALSIVGTVDAIVAMGNKPDEAHLATAASLIVSTFGVAIANTSVTLPIGVPLRDGLMRLSRVPSYIAAQDYSAIAIDVVAIVVGFEDTSRPLSPEIGRTITFAVDLIDAKDATTMKAVMKKFVAPVGSFAKKREGGAQNHVYATVNAYAGGAGGDEIAHGHGAVALAPFLPVGFEVGVSGARLALFVPLIDLGQLAAWRLTGGDKVNASPPDAKVSDVLAPGGYLMYGVDRTIPVSLGAGFTYAPAFRTVKSNGTTSTPVNAWRYNVIVALDLPLFP